jgi:Fur family ferric uptake transcriptional regulator
MTSNTAHISDLLSKHQVRKTKIRIAILELFMARNYALSHAEIEQVIKNDFDRVTIYRTLKSFEEQGLIHKVLDDSGASKYALCSHNCASSKHFDTHVHFNCTQCGKTFCLDSVPIPAIALPENYRFDKLDFLASGICKNCQ